MFDTEKRIKINEVPMAQTEIVYVPDIALPFSSYQSGAFHLISFLLLLPARLTGMYPNNRGACHNFFVATYRCWLISLSSFLFFFFPFFFFFVLTISVSTIALKGDVSVHIVRFHIILLPSFSFSSTTSSVIAICRLLSVRGSHRRYRHRDLVPTILLQQLLLRQ